MAIRSQTTKLGRTRWTAERARAVLAEQEKSGESLSAFARRPGLQAQRLYWWRKRLAEWGAAEPEGGQRLVAVVTPEVSRAPSETASAVQVRLRCGEVEIEVTGAAALPPSWLAELVRELRAAR